MLDKKPPREKLIEEAFRRAGLDSKCLDDWERLLRPFMDAFEFFGLSAERAEDWERLRDVLLPIPTGRKPSPRLLQSIKGFLAGAAFVQMAQGMPRRNAMAWVARTTPSDLARWISSKPIRSSTVEEWMKRYGGTLQMRRDFTFAARRVAATLPERLERAAGAAIREVLPKYVSVLRGEPGKIACMRMIFVALSIRYADLPVPFDTLLSNLQTEAGRLSPNDDAFSRERRPSAGPLTAN